MMTGTDQEGLFDKMMLLWLFIQMNMVLFFITSRHRKQQNPAPGQPEPQPQPCKRRRKATESTGYALDTAEGGKGMIQNTLGRANQN